MMTLEQIKNILPSLDKVEFLLEDGTKVPEHFHVTEVGVINKHFIDCGGTIRDKKVANFQIWNAQDFDHRLAPGKLLDIIKLSQEKLGIEDIEVEVEYQGKTIEKYNIDFNGKSFVLVSKKTNCLADDRCGIPEDKLPKEEKSCCTPGGGCC